MKEYPQAAIDSLPENLSIVGWGWNNMNISLFGKITEAYKWYGGQWNKGCYIGSCANYLYAVEVESPKEKKIAFEMGGEKYVIKIGRNTNGELYRIITPNAPKEVLELFDIIFAFFYKQEV